ncbi:MAG: cytochrome d ubiquinol oxidase subunit II [Bacteroidota bacterium]
MFETLSQLSLQQYWWVIVSLLGSLLVFLLFVQGGQTLLFSLGKTEEEKTMIVNSLGRKWEFTFTTLVTFGGAFFASFPLFYSTSFGGAYWVWMAILFCFIVQAIAYEFRKKEGNVYGSKFYEILLFINGSLGPLLLGVAVATFFTGSAFSVNKMNITNIGGMNVISGWEGPAKGLEAVLSFHNVSLGLAVLFLSRILGGLYLINTINDENIYSRAKRCLLINTIPFLVFFLFFVIRLLFIDGYAVNPATKEVFMESYKYLHNFLQMPMVLVIFLVGVLLVLWGIISTLFMKSLKGIWFTGIGVVLTVLMLFMLAGLNNTSYYPSSFDLQSSLTIENSSSSHYTLTAMSYVSLLVPFVLAYIVWFWRKMNSSKITAQEMQDDAHSY